MTEIVLNGDQNDILTVLAVMLFPNDKVQQQQYVSINQGLVEAYNNDGNISDVTSESLIHAHRPEDIENKIIPKLSNKVLIVGDMLATQYLLHYHSSIPPSLSKANFIVVQREKELLNDDGKRQTISERAVYDYWKEYKSVAHLWAAYFLNGYVPYHEDENIFQDKAFPTFIGIAAHVQDFATKFKPAQATKPMLDPNEIWSLPEYVTRIQLTGKPELSPLREILKSYEPKKTTKKNKSKK